MTFGEYACRSTFAFFGGLIREAGLTSSPRSSTQKLKNDLTIASLFRRVAGDDSLQCSSRKSLMSSTVSCLMSV